VRLFIKLLIANVHGSLDAILTDDPALCRAMVDAHYPLRVPVETQMILSSLERDDF
jgi:hypothetical protein